VIGRPIEHSLSPVIHNAAFEAVGIDWTFERFDVGEDEVASFLARAVRAGFGGLSVTMPDKAVVAGLVDDLTPDAELLGAVNAVIFDDGATLGDNFDGVGFVDALTAERPAVGLAGARIAVVGAGGAARSVVLAVSRAGAAEVVVVNRTASKAEEATRLAPGRARIGDASSLPSVDVIVNATPLGMGSGSTDELPFDPEVIGPDQVVCDLIYWPGETAILREARARGAATVNGLGMLVHQAARAFTAWTGLEAPVDVMTAAARAELQRRGPAT
jgi:shikimate dehydrogenase